MNKFRQGFDYLGMLYKKDKNQERKRALKNAYVRAIAHPNLAKISVVQAGKPAPYPRDIRDACPTN